MSDRQAKSAQINLRVPDDLPGKMKLAAAILGIRPSELTRRAIDRSLHEAMAVDAADTERKQLAEALRQRCAASAHAKKG